MAYEDDRPDKELLQIIKDSTLKVVEHKNASTDTAIMDQDLLMQKLCSFVIRRDSKVWNHAYKLGQQNAVDKAKKT